MMNLRSKKLLIISLILISSLLSGCSLLRGIIPSLPNKEASPVHNLTKDTYYNTIQAAVDAASSGDTIIVRDGTYIENVNVYKDHLTIKSENGAEATIVQAANPDDHVFEVISDYVTIKGFTIIGVNQVNKAGIYLFHVEHCNISNNICKNNYYFGISLDSSSFNVIENNNCSANNGGGIGLSTSSLNTLENNTCSKNKWDGIALAYSDDNVLKNNICSENDNFPGYDGIRLDFSLRNTLENNLCSKNTLHGIALGWSSDNNTLRSNICSRNNVGIVLDSSSANTLENNTCESNLCGIELVLSTVSPSFNILKNNVCKSNWKGLALFGSSHNIIYLNNFLDNTYNIYSTDSTNNWNSLEPITYTYNSNTYTNYLGNYWNDYTGSDANGDGIGYTPYTIDGDSDSYPLMEPFENYQIGAPSFDFSLSVNPTSGTMPQSGSITANVNVNLTSGVSESVSLNAEGLPGAIILFDPDTNTPPFDSEIWISTKLTAPPGLPSPGEYSIVITGTGGGVSKTTMFALTIIVDNIVENQPPVADAGVNQTVYSGQVVWFDGSNSADPDGTIVSYEWDFGDGETATGVTAAHRFRGWPDGLRTYNVTLMVEDDRGVTATDNKHVSVDSLRKRVEYDMVVAIASMMVSYNWVDEINAEDIYIVSKIKTASTGVVGLHQVSITRETHQIWSDALITIAVIKEVAYISPFTPTSRFGVSPPVETKSYNDGTFTGIEVRASDKMNLWVLGVTSIGVDGGEASTAFEPAAPVEYPLEPYKYMPIGEAFMGLLNSPGELRVYDSQGRVTGLVDGEVREEIPDSAYANNAVVIAVPADTYYYEVVGTGDGSYGLVLASVEDGEVTTFTATDIPTTSGAIHQYIIDWDALAQGEEGVTIKIDSDGDGTFELTITTGSTFIFIPVPATINIDPDTLNLKSKIKWITAYIELPEDYDVTNIDVSTVNLWYEGSNVPAEWGDIQDGTLMVKFNGKAVQDLFTGPVDAATIAVTGVVQDGTPFGGNDTIRVIKKP